MSEKVCSIIIEIPNLKRNYLKQETSEICKRNNLKRKECSHISIEPSFRCTSEKFRISLNSLLMMQETFDINLDTIGFFEKTKEKSGLAYLTTSNKGQIEKLTDLYNKVEKIIDAKGRPFIPHVALIDWAPINDVIDAGYMLQTRINSMGLTVNELVLKKRETLQHWKDYGRFSFGESNFHVNDFLQQRANINQFF